MAASNYSGERRPRHCSSDDRKTVKKREYEDQGSEQHWDESQFIVDWGKTGRTQAGHPPLSHYTAGSRQYETDLADPVVLQLVEHSGTLKGKQSNHCLKRLASGGQPGRERVGKGF